MAKTKVDGSMVTDNTLSVDALLTVECTAAGKALLDDADAAAQVATLKLAGAGNIIAWPTSTPPTGYLECDGSAVSRTTYAPLFAVISDDYGVGDGSTTFNLPDFRGEFLRGWDNGRGVDSGRAIASTQADELEAHTHTFYRSGSTTSSGNIYSTASGSSASETFTTNSTGGSETRPRNVAIMFCIKY